MKLSEMFIGQIVMMDKDSDWKNNRIPNVGKVVDIALAYDVSTISMSTSPDPIEVLPVVHFVGEDMPRKVNPIHLKNIRRRHEVY